MFKKRKKKEEAKWFQLEGFLLGIEKNSKGHYLVCKNVAQTWSIRWRDDTMMFGLMQSIMENENAVEYLHSLLTVMYISSSYAHDLLAASEEGKMPFMEGFAKLVEDQNNLELKYKPHATEEEDAKELSRLRDLSEMEGELRNINEETDVHKETVGGGERVYSPQVEE